NRTDVGSTAGRAVPTKTLDPRVKVQPAEAKAAETSNDAAKTLTIRILPPMVGATLQRSLTPIRPRKRDINLRRNRRTRPHPTQNHPLFTAPLSHNDLVSACYATHLSEPSSENPPSQADAIGRGALPDAMTGISIRRRNELVRQARLTVGGWSGGNASAARGVNARPR